MRELKNFFFRKRQTGHIDGQQPHNTFRIDLGDGRTSQNSCVVNCIIDVNGSAGTSTGELVKSKSMEGKQDIRIA